jgi:hypothetical protein
MPESYSWRKYKWRAHDSVTDIISILCVAFIISVSYVINIIYIICVTATIQENVSLKTSTQVLIY